MDNNQHPSRRTVLTSGTATVGAVALGAVTLSACGSSSNSGSGSNGNPDTVSSSASASASSGDSGNSGSGAGTTIVALSKVPVGGAVSATADGKKIIVAQPTSGQAVAFSAICTHMGCTVAPSGSKLNCPCHGSVFDALTGKNVSGPAPSPLPAVDVHVADGNVVAGKA